MNGRSIACFFIEIALDPATPTCGGGPGILAGDTRALRGGPHRYREVAAPGM